MAALTLHLARLVFSPTQREYALHTDLCHAFGSRREGAYLFRTEIDRRERPPRRIVLVQSIEPGQWSRVGERLVSHELVEKHWHLEVGTRYRFFLRANPTLAKKATLRELAEVTHEDFREARGKRVAIRGEAGLLAWLGRQATRHGFRLVETDFREDSGEVTRVAAVRVSQGRDLDWSGNGKRGHHEGADFEGLLEVAEPDALRAALVEGIGPGKAFGYGLLSLARPE